MVVLADTSVVQECATGSPAQIVTVSGQSYFIVKVPFETRSIQGGSSLTATPNTLVLTTVNTTYAVSANVGTSIAEK